MKLYELSNNLIAIQNMIEEGSEGLEDTLEALELSFDEKAENIVKLMRSVESEVSSINDEVDRLKGMMKRKQTSLDKLHSYLDVNMRKLELSKVKSSLFDIKMVKNPPKVEISNEELISDVFKTSKTVVTIDKASIKEALKCGLDVPGATMVQETRLSIK